MRSSTASTSSPRSSSRRPRSSSNISTKPAIAFSARVFSIGTLPWAAATSASPKPTPVFSAYTATHASARSPIPRRGVLRMRRRLTASPGLSSTRR
ncbi:Uncharacterised protein [Mycobacterium tuberculosis]|uniref:Uncharacterized protein n=1 Tax=Mycobacterium tuberculosis TaxID=1773 RepID=A0A916P9B8_MYCTX|nr:Uncharacterised protein [Mycobacterium tuberculosis]